jgi:hypothetical protein
METRAKTINLVDRGRRILVSPSSEWDVIEAEPLSQRDLFTSYVMPLAAIGPVARLIGYSVIGLSVFMGGVYRVPLVSGLASAVVLYGLMLGGTYLLGLIIDGLAPTFNGHRSRIQALKLAAFSSTPAWLAGAFMLIPALSPLMILGVYSVYLLYLGLPKLMKSPPDKTLAYAAVVVVAGIVIFAMTGAIAGRLIPVPTAAVTIP